MSNTILGSLMSPLKTTITDSETGSYVMSGMSVIRATMDSPSDITTKPIQTSGVTDSAGDSAGNVSVASDLSPSKVIHPATIEIEAIMDTSDSILELIRLHNDPTTLFNVLVKSVYFKGMTIVRAVLTNSGEHLNVTVARIHLEQAVPPSTQSTSSPQQSPDSPTYGFGVQQPVTLSDTVSGLYDRMKNSLKFDDIRSRIKF